jgi:hypothetical protein
VHTEGRRQQRLKKRTNLKFHRNILEPYGEEIDETPHALSRAAAQPDRR